MNVSQSPFIRNKLRLSITGCCNLNCFYCHNEGQGHGNDSFMDPLLAEKIAAYVQRAGFKIDKLNLTGGEPLLHPQLDRIIQTFLGVCDEIRLNTNGILLTEQRIDTLARLGVKELKIGIDSLWNQKDQDRIKNADRDRLIELIDYASGKCRVVLNMVVTSHNADRIDEMIRFCEQHKIRRLKLNELVELETSRSEDGSDDVRQIYLQACCRFRKESISANVIDELGREEMLLPSGLKLIWCRSFCTSRSCGSMYTVIDSSGSVVLCSRSSQKQPIDFSFDRPSVEITEDILRAQETICSIHRRYIRDIHGERIVLESEGDDETSVPYDRKWNWEANDSPYWIIPEPIARGYAAVWKQKYPDGTLLDLGAGLGRHARLFAENGFEVTALDSSRFAIDRINEIEKQQGYRERPIRTICADMREIPSPDESFDIVFAYNAITHTDSFLFEKVVSEIARVLKPDGEAFLTLCSKSSSDFLNPDYPRIDECTVLKLKSREEYGVAHLYVDLDDILKYFKDFKPLRISEVADLWYDGGRHDSHHYHLLLRKKTEKRHE